MSTLVYFSSSSENTLRFMERLGLPAIRIPLNERERIQVDEPYILVVPSYGGGGTAGAVPRQVIRFLNDPHNRQLIRGVIAAGNPCRVLRVIGAGERTERERQELEYRK